MQFNRIVFVLFSVIFTTSLQLRCMHESIRKQLEQAQKELAETRCEYLSTEEGDAHAEYNRTLAHIVRNAGNLMSNQEKLNHLYGDPRWEDRKEVIQQMIIGDHVDPNTIKYHGYTPMQESIAYNDVAFTAYLLKHGTKRMTDQEKLGFIPDWELRKQ